MNHPIVTFFVVFCGMDRERALIDYGSQLTTKSGVKATSEVLSSVKLIGVYFSAHWVRMLRSLIDIFLKSSLFYFIVLVPTVPPVYSDFS